MTMLPAANDIRFGCSYYYARSLNEMHNVALRTSEFVMLKNCLNLATLLIRLLDQGILLNNYHCRLVIILWRQCQFWPLYGGRKKTQLMFSDHCFLCSQVPYAII